MKELYIVPEDSRNKPYNIQIKSIGPKYITTIDRKRFNKSIKPPFYSADDIQGWNPCLVAYESKEQFEQIKSTNLLKKKLKDTIIAYINNCDDVAKLTKIDTLLKNQI